MNLRRLIQGALHPLGVELRRWHPEHQEHPRVKRILDELGTQTVLDIGANSGQFASQLRATGFSGRIISFEPQADAHLALVAAATADPQWTIATRCALGDSEGSMTMHRAGNSVSSSLLPMLGSLAEAARDAQAIGQEVVPVLRLDQHPDLATVGGDVFAKIDTQGYELHVLRGAERLMPRIAGVLVEASLVPLYAGQPLLAEVVAFLDAKGFAIVDLLPEFQHPRHGQMLQVDLIATRKANAGPA
jgi:FkbM family methyltransferase